jgi:phosphosulfolactate phosphohydrolase-like enzyme
MNLDDIQRKNLILIQYLQTLITTFKIKAEYSTNDKDSKIVTVQEQTGQKIVFFDKDTTPLFNYYMVDIYGLSIQECKNTAVIIGNLIGESVLFDVVNTINDEEYNEKWQIIFKQFSNPQAIMYEDIRRVGYNATLKCIVNMVARSKVVTE